MLTIAPQLGIKKLTIPPQYIVKLVNSNDKHWARMKIDDKQWVVKQPVLKTML
jgi:hypothetical protein